MSYVDGERKYQIAKPFEGVITNLKRRHTESESDFVKEEIYTKFMQETVCPSCKGLRLKPEALSVIVDGRNIAQMAALPIAAALKAMTAPDLSATERTIATSVMESSCSREPTRTTRRSRSS